MSTKKLTVLFAPLDSIGHINACHGIAEILRDRGHRVVFAVDIAFKGKLKAHDFEEELLEMPKTGDEDNQEIDIWSEFVYKFKDVYSKSAIEIVGTSTVTAFDMMTDRCKAIDSQYKHIINQLKPDLIVIDSYIGSPTLTHSGIPWVWLCSAAPHMFFNSPQLPPAFSGLPLNGNRNEWQEFRTKYDKIFFNLHNKISDWFVSAGAPPLASDRGSIIHPESPFLNIYLYPEELDYEELQPLPHNWIRSDGTLRKTNETFTLPEYMSKRPGKLIFFTIGSYGSSNLDVMIRLTQILGKSEHKFIVSKGPLHDRYELPDNMWGQKFVPQMAVLPLVSLVITHGGNNTVLEAFYFGKPLLVLPMSGDQLDNAQRIHETGLGTRLSPYHSSDEQLLTTIDKMVNDLELSQKMQNISKRLRNSNDSQLIAKRIENIFS